MGSWASLVAELVKNRPAMQETPVRVLGQQDPWRRDRLPTPVFLDLPGGSDGKESTCNAGDLGSIPGLGRCPGEGHDNPLQYSCLENLHGQKSLAGYSSWGRKGSDMTERLSTAQQTTIHNISNDIAACLYFLYFSFSQSLWILLTPGRF